eukprot:scaffold1166_cov261-Pinguiococcus_pyrenoidosus.AAC.2
MSRRDDASSAASEATCPRVPMAFPLVSSRFAPVGWVRVRLRASVPFIGRSEIRDSKIRKLRDRWISPGASLIRQLD